MGTLQTKNNSKQDAQHGKGEGKGKNERRKSSSPDSAGNVADSGRRVNKGGDGDTRNR